MVWPVARPAEEAGFFAWRPLRGRPRRTALPSFLEGRDQSRRAPAYRKLVRRRRIPASSLAEPDFETPARHPLLPQREHSAGAFAGPAPERPLGLADAASSGDSDPRRLGCEVGV
jgi:hypothetical protein